jgi:biotin transport system substrate-specific component
MGRFSIGPATGYFVGFFLSAVLISLLKGSKINPIRYFLAAIVAVLVTNTCGTISMELATGMGWKAAFLSGFVVFLPGDICKAIAAALLGAALNKALTKLPARA